MIIFMSQHNWEFFDDAMAKLNDEKRIFILSNIHCYDYFITIPDDCPEEIVNDVKNMTKLKHCF